MLFLTSDDVIKGQQTSDLHRSAQTPWWRHHRSQIATGNPDIYSLIVRGGSMEEGVYIDFSAKVGWHVLDTISVK